MKSILQHIIINSDNCDKLIEFIGYGRLISDIMPIVNIPSNLIMELINNEEFKKNVNGGSVSKSDMGDLFLTIIDIYMNDHHLIELNKFIRILPKLLLEKFFSIVNEIIHSDNDYRYIKIINNCKRELLKPKYKHNQTILKSLALTGIYKNLNELLSEYHPLIIIDSLLYRQRNKKVSKYIIHCLSTMKHIVSTILVYLINPILAKFVIKNACSLDFVQLDIVRYYNFPTLYYAYKTVNKKNKELLLNSCVKLFNSENLIKFQHRKMFNVVSSVLSSKMIKRIRLLYKLIVQLLQAFTSKNMIRLVLYFV